MSIKITTTVAGLALAVILSGTWILSHRGEDGAELPLRELSRAQLDLREDILYPSGESIAFDGALVEYFPGKIMRISIEIHEGQPHGVSRGWHENGQLEVEEHFVRSVSHGPRTRWFASGAKKSEAQIVEGIVEGTFTRWHENGQMAASATMLHGVPHGVCKSWHASGKLKSRAVMNTGTIVEREFFDDPGEPSSPTTSS